MQSVLTFLNAFNFKHIKKKMIDCHGGQVSMICNDHCVILALMNECGSSCVCDGVVSSVIPVNKNGHIIIPLENTNLSNYLPPESTPYRQLIHFYMLVSDREV